MNKAGKLFEGNLLMWIIAIVGALMFAGILPNFFHLSILDNNSVLDTTDTTSKQVVQSAQQTNVQIPVEKNSSKYTGDTGDTSNTGNKIYYFPLIVGIIYLIFFLYRYLLNKKRKEKRMKLMEEYDGKTKKRRSNLSKRK